MRLQALTTPADTPAGVRRIRAFITRLARQPSRDAPWLARFQEALLLDPDLDQALVDNAEGLARSALAAIVYRLYRDEAPDSIRAAMSLLGVTIR